MDDYPQESYTALTEQPLYGNVNLEEPQEEYANISETQSALVNSQRNDPEQPDEDDPQLIYENYNSPTQLKPAGTHVQRNESAKQLPDTDPKPNVGYTEDPDWAAPIKDGSKDSPKSDELTTTIPNLYITEPIGPGFQDFANHVEEFLPTRKPKSADKTKCLRCVLICSAIFGSLLVISLVMNIALICVYFIKEIDADAIQKERIKQLQTKWESGEIKGNTINMGVLVNVASVYKGATCQASSMNAPSAHAHERSWCQYAIDGRVNGPAWAPNEGDGKASWLEIKFNAFYTVVVLEVVRNNSDQEGWKLGLTYSDMSTEKFCLPRVAGNQSDGYIARDVIVLNHVNTSAVRLDFTGETGETSPIRLLETRIFGYGDDPRVNDVTCCPDDDFVYSVELGRCYYFPSNLTASTPLSHEDANKTCQARGSELLSLHSRAEHVFVGAHLIDLWIKSADIAGIKDYSGTVFWTSLKRFPENSTTWRWDGVLDLTYQAWQYKQPNSQFGEQCMQLRPPSATSVTYNWNDKSCTGSTSLYVCQAEAMC